MSFTPQPSHKALKSWIHVNKGPLSKYSSLDHFSYIPSTQHLLFSTSISPTWHCHFYHKRMGTKVIFLYFARISGTKNWCKFYQEPPQPPGKIFQNLNGWEARDKVTECKQWPVISPCLLEAPGSHSHTENPRLNFGVTEESTYIGEMGEL